MTKKRLTAENAEVRRESLFYSALFAYIEVYNFSHRKVRKVRKDSLNGLVFDYNAVKIRSLMQ
jgi:hypothetical protein